MKILNCYGELLLEIDAPLIGANLRDANLIGANLRDANLRDANLRDANLIGANLRDANLIGANLIGANLRDANLRDANLIGANLRDANLRDANLIGANLIGANLKDANLRDANLYRVSVAGSCLDPEVSPNAQWPCDDVDGWIIGYRTRKAGHIDCYRDGRIYSADWFSVSDIECHPGLYLWPTIQQAREFSGSSYEFISVRTRRADVHQAGRKWRCRWFEVLGKVK